LYTLRAGLTAACSCAAAATLLVAPAAVNAAAATPISIDFLISDLSFNAVGIEPRNTPLAVIESTINSY
jgi:hypothetical protein